MMCKLGYELVDASEESPSESAAYVGSPSGGTPLTEVIREAKREAYYEGLEQGIRLPAAFLPAGIDVRDYYKTPYDPEPPKGESEEFEVVCGVDLGIGLGGGMVGGEVVLRDSRLIPGKTYVVREK